MSLPSGSDPAGLAAPREAYSLVEEGAVWVPLREVPGAVLVLSERIPACRGIVAFGT